MSWVFPTSLMRTGTVLDWMDVNEQLAAYASVIDGGISEHNLGSTVGSDLYTTGKLAQDVAVRAGSIGVALSPFTTASLIQVPMSEQWTAVDGSEIDIRGPAGMVVITYSFQVVFGLFDTDTPGLQFAIELDGSARNGTLLGSGDMSNDLYNQDDVDAVQIPTESGASIKHDLSPHCVEGVFPVDSGAHTARLLVRNPYVVRSGTKPEMYIGSLEGIHFHLWA